MAQKTTKGNGNSGNNNSGVSLGKKDKHKTKKGNYYADTRAAIYSNEVYRIETSEELFEYKKLKDLPANLQDKCKKKPTN